MNWSKFRERLYSLRLYGLAIFLFMAVLTLLEMNNVLPERLSSRESETPLKSISPATLNMQQSTEFIGTVMSVDDEAGTAQILVVLQIQERKLLARGDLLLIPGIGFGVVSDVTTERSVMGHVRVLVDIESTSFSVGSTVMLYK